MHRAMKVVVALVLLAALTIEYEPPGFRITAAYAQASGDLTISWTPPTEYTDGAALLEQDLDFYTFKCNGLDVTQIDSVVGTWTATVSTAALASGDYACALTVTTLLGAESGDSNPVNFTIGPRVPMAPAALTLT